MKIEEMEDVRAESPEFLRISLAAAMTLGIRRGLFFRGAELHCINLLMTYEDGCKANCAYCGLQHRREGRYRGKSFIRVPWPVVSVEDIIRRCTERPTQVKRICLSMITHRRAVEDSHRILERLKEALPRVPLSLLCTPTLLDKDDLLAYRKIPVERLGIAVDAANEEIFDRLRGRGAPGPHRWDHYWRLFEESVEIFGTGRVGVHLIVGLGETEEEMVRVMDRIHKSGGSTHLFCFFPEAGSRMEQVPQPPVSQYRRVQLARHLIDEGIASYQDFTFNPQGQILSFGIDSKRLEAEIQSGIPFMTSGCPDDTGRTVCTRPYGDCKPGEDIRSYPFPPDEEDLIRIQRQLLDYGPTGSP